MLFRRIFEVSGGIAVVMISTASLGGHFLNITMFYRWHINDVGMALNTSVALLIIGVQSILRSLKTP